MDVQTYLRRLPQLLDFKNEEKLERNVQKALYYALSKNGEYFDSLFTRPVKGGDIYPWDPKTIDGIAFYERIADGGDYSHPPDMACGRILEKGDRVFRCEECGYDSTCVLCEYCFNPDDHIDHSVTVYSSAMASGTCDCGDDSAFVNELNCLCSISNSEISDLPAGFRESIHNTVKIALDYILDVLNFAVAPLPLIHSNINTAGCELTSETLSKAGALPSEKYGGEDKNSVDLWYLLLWNDENHDYPEAEAGIRAATGVSESRAKEIATTINATGRAILKESSRYESLLESQEAAQRDGLVATICSARDYMREEIVLHILTWLTNVSSFKGNMAVKDQAKKSIAELLLEPDYHFMNQVPVDLLEISDLKRKCFENGLLYDGQLLNLAHVKLQPKKLSEINLTDPFEKFVEVDSEIQVANSRLQYLFAFEVRFTSVARKLFTTTFLPILTASIEIKARFADQYIDVFPTLMSIFAFSDREEELTSVVHISLQLFSCPRTNQYIAESGKFSYLLGPGALLMEGHAAKLNEDDIPNTIDVVMDLKSKREKSGMQKTLITYTDVFGKILAQNDSDSLLNVIWLNDTLYYMLFFLRCFHGLLSLTRKYGDHVERESLLDFVTFLQKGIPVLEIVKNSVSTKNAVDQTKLEEAISIVAKFLSTRKQADPSFKVSRDPVTFLNPINSLLALLLQKAGDVTEVTKHIFRQESDSFSHISEYSLRSLVLTSQIKVGLWIRNGLVVSRQASYYSNTKISQVSYLGDFYLNQVALLIDEPEEFLAKMIKMWELEPWTSNTYDHSELKTYESKDWKPQNAAEECIVAYDNRWGVMCEQFILFLYNLLTNRMFFKDSESSALSRQKAKKALCYILCQGPKSYSDLRNELPSSYFNDKSFDQILKECADYQAPTGFTDSGIYRLKNEIYGELDPFNTLDSSTSQTVYEAISAHNKQKSSGVEGESLLIIEPIFTMSDYPSVNQKLGEFTRTEGYARMIVNLLEVSISSKNEEFIPHLLQLIHASLVDAELVHGKNYLSPHFKKLAIAHSLFKLHELDVSANVNQKTRYLIEDFLVKDENIALDMSHEFGQDKLDKFRKSQSPALKPKAPRKSNAAGRNAKIMKKFEAQRQLFLENQESETITMEHASDSETEVETDFLRCVACGELQGFDEAFGIPLATTKSWIFCKLPKQPQQFYDTFYDYAPEREEIIDSLLDHKTLYSKDRKMNLVGTSCGHGIHFKCLDDPLFDGSISCPLCHNAYDDVIPTFTCAPSKQFLSDDIIYGKPLPVPSMRSIDKFTNIFETTIHPSYRTMFPRDETRLHPMFTKKYLPDDSPATLSDTVNRICFLISDTIQANEIALRMDGPVSRKNFIQQSPAAFKIQIRTLIQDFAFFCEEYKDDLKSSVFVEPFAREEVQFNSVFKEVIFTFLQTEYSLITAIRFGYAKLVAITLKQLCSDYKLPVHFFAEARTSRPFFHNTDQANLLRTFCKQLFGMDLETDLEHILYEPLETCLSPYLRCCALFLDIVLSSKSGNNEFKSHPKFDGLSAQVDKQATEYSCDALCDLCELPRIPDLMAAYVNSPPLGLKDRYSKRELWFEVQVLEMFAQNYSSLYPAITALEYPNAPRLAQLPDSYSSLLTELEFKGQYESICLLCGDLMARDEEKFHLQINKACSSPSLFFSPDNSIRVAVTMGQAMKRTTRIPGPYLTEHGEVATHKRQGKAKINLARYNQLNKMWLNQDLLGYVTRTSFGASRDEMGFADVEPPVDMTQAGMTARMLVETFQEALMADESEEDEDEDEDDEWYV